MSHLHRFVTVKEAETEQLSWASLEWLCRDSVCDLFAGWTCVVPAPPGDACPTDGATFACTSGRCEGGTCAEFFTCP